MTRRVHITIKLAIAFVLTAAAIVVLYLTLGNDKFYQTKGLRFEKNGPVFLYSMNYWQGMHMAVANRTRLLNDLDKLKSEGVNNLRIMASSEGPDTEPFRVVPSLMATPGNYNEKVLDGLDFLTSELSKRNISVVMCMNNYWHWSGGFSQYVSWTEGTQIPYPSSWDPLAKAYTNASFFNFIIYTNNFYSNTKANELFKNHVSFIMNRINNYSNQKYKDDGNIFSWEIANEPQNVPKEWVVDMAKYFKSIDSKHMVTVGLESRMDLIDFNNAHLNNYIDYATVHIWPQNRNVYNMMDDSEINISNAIKWFEDTLFKVDSWAKKLGKPLVLEEFGMPRDNFIAKGKSSDEIYSQDNPITRRDRLFDEVLAKVVASYLENGAYSGFGAWTYGGEARPGDDLLGDPLHEAPGWYDVYDTDKSTFDIFSKHYQNVNK